MKRVAQGFLSSLRWAVKNAFAAMLALQLGMGELPVWVPIGHLHSTAYAGPSEPSFSSEEVSALPHGLHPEEEHPHSPLSSHSLSEDSHEDPVARVEGLAQSFADLRTRHRLDPYQLLMQEREVGLEETHAIAANRLAFRPNGENARAVSWRNLEGQLLTYEAPVALQVLDGETPRWLWHVQATHLTRVGKYLIFVQEGARSEEGTYLMASLVDVTFGKGLGAEQSPVYRLPFRIQGDFQGFEYRDEVLIARSEIEAPMPLSIVEAAATASESAFHLYANALSPQFWETVDPLADSLTSAVSDLIAQTDRGMGRDLFQNASSKLGQERWEQDFIEGISDGMHLRDAVAANTTNQPDPRLGAQIARRVTRIAERVQQSEAASKRVWARVALLWRWMTLPRPNGSVRGVMEALSILAAREELRSGKTEEAVLKIFWDKRVQLGGAVVVGSMLAMTFPEAAEALLTRSLEMGSIVLDALFGRLQHVREWGVHSTEVTFGFLREPMQLYTEYLSPERVHKTAVGLTAVGAMVMGSIGVTHVLSNLHALYQDLKRTGMTFVERERERQRRHYESLQHAERISERTLNVQFSDEDTERVREIISNADQVEKAWVVRMMQKLRARARGGAAETRSLAEIENIWHALKSLLWSPASWVTTSRPLVLMKQGIFGYQSFVYKPSVMIMMLLYPKYLSTALRGRSHIRLEKFPVVEMSGITIPSELNGGMRNWFEELKRMTITPEKELRELEEWEERIGVVEREIQRASFQKAFSATLEFARANGQSLRRFYSGDMVLDFFDPKLKKIAKSQRAFLRIYFDRLNEEAMGRYLRDLAQEMDVETEDLGVPTDANVLRELKRRTLAAAERVALDETSARAFVDDVADSEGIETFAR